jgi:hypothetical protein
MIPHTYHILASRTQTLDFDQHVIFPCPKVAFRKRLPQHQKKGIGPCFEHSDTFYIYLISRYTNSTWSFCHICGVMAWGGEQYNRHKMARNAPVGKKKKL